MDLGLKGKIAIVTGAGSQKGMGKAISLILAREGCDVVEADIDVEGMKKTANEIMALGRKCIVVKADVTNSTQVNDTVKSALAQFGKIDILVNNAGALFTSKPFIDSIEIEWEKDINLNFKGVLNCTKAVLPCMIQNKTGKIINISSIGGRKGGARSAIYNAAKAAVINFTKSMAIAVGPYGINVNSVAPGLVFSNFGAGSPPPGAEIKVMETVPLKRITTTQDIANAVLFFASDMSSDITGQTLGVDGGEYMV